MPCSCWLACFQFIIFALAARRHTPRQCGISGNHVPIINHAHEAIVPGACIRAINAFPHTYTSCALRTAADCAELIYGRDIDTYMCVYVVCPPRASRNRICGWPVMIGWWYGRVAWNTMNKFKSMCISCYANEHYWHPTCETDSRLVLMPNQTML